MLAPATPQATPRFRQPWPQSQRIPSLTSARERIRNKSFITQPLTLQGIKSGALERARIVPPLDIGGVIPWITVPNSVSGELPIAPQIFVNVPAGTVKITNLTVDASAETKAAVCSSTSPFVTSGIVYKDSSGTITDNNTLDQGKNSGCGVGILTVASASNAVSVTVTNNSVQDANLAGIKLEAATGNAGIKASVTGNSVEVGTGVGSSNPNSGIQVFGVTGTVASNFVSAGTFLGGLGHDILEIAENDVGPLSISNNSIYGLRLIGITLQDPITHTRTVNGNKLVEVGEGLVISGRGGKWNPNDAGK
jgi:hypothetical protein